MEPRTCDTCRNLESDVKTEITTERFVGSAEKCSWCSAVLRAVQSVTDIARPEFSTVTIEFGGKYLPKGVIYVACNQEGVPIAGKLQNAMKDPFPNRYSIYTPKSAGHGSTIPGLGLRDGKDDDYQEHLESIDDRLQFAKSWRADCTKNHPTCELSVRSWPRRVLDLASDPVRLRSSPDPAADIRYAALSYCWGRTENMRTLKGNIVAHQQGLLMSSLPRTVSDAIYVCRAIGVRYLWVDALCIVQDDTDDWTDQIPMMSSIYAGAEVTIAAQAAATSQAGFLEFGISGNAPFKRLEFEQEFDGEPRTVKLSIQEENSEYHLVPGHHSSRPDGDDVDLDPLRTRAWAFQERFLSRRILYISQSEMSWKCSQYKRCECKATPRYSYVHNFNDFWGTSQLSEITNSGGEPLRNSLKILSLWGEVVRQFSERSLTNWTDRLAAVQGIVVALTEAFPHEFTMEDYLFGMWRQNLERLLTWHAIPVDMLQQSQRGAPQPTKGVLPSWSWAGTSGPVDYYMYAWEPESVLLIRVEQIDVSMSNSIMLGGGQGTITLSGLLIPTCGQLNGLLGEFATPLFHLPCAFKGTDDWAFDPVLEMDVDDPTDDGIWKTVTHFLPLIKEAGGSPKTQGIFLAPVAGLKNTFCRVGYHYDYGCSISFGREVEVETYRETFDLV